MLENTEKQRLREAALEYLAARPSSKFTLPAIARMLRVNQLVDFKFDEEDLAEALAILEGYKFAVKSYPKLGALREWKATHEGVLFNERGE